MSSYLVFFMQAGFAMVEAGTTRAKNIKNILLKNLVDTGVASMVWFGIGHAFAFGDGNGFIGTRYFFLYNYDDYPYFMFQWAFATTAVSIISGSLAERTQFTSFLISTAIVAGWVYPIIAHWAWSDAGWLRNLGANGFIDYAGGGVVHMVGGGVGLVGAIVVGPRMGRFDSAQKDGCCFSLKRPKVHDIPGHNSPLIALGIFILWFGWFGFNSGSTLGLSLGRHSLAGRIAVNTAMASTAACLSSLMLIRFLTGQYNLEASCNGLLTGAVAVTSSCAVIEPWAAVFIGVGGGFVYYAARELLLCLRIDDPLEAAPVHFFGGMWGLLCIGFFAQQAYVTSAYGSDTVYGLFHGGGAEQLGIQLCGIVVIVVWVTLWSLPMFLVLRYFHKLRVSHEVEVTGLDITKHGGSAYPYFVQTGYVDGGEIVPIFLCMCVCVDLPPSHSVTSLLRVFAISSREPPPTFSTRHHLRHLRPRRSRQGRHRRHRSTHKHRHCRASRAPQTSSPCLRQRP